MMWHISVFRELSAEVNKYERKAEDFYGFSAFFIWQKKRSYDTLKEEVKKQSKECDQLRNAGGNS